MRSKDDPLMLKMAVLLALIVELPDEFRAEISLALMDFVQALNAETLDLKAAAEFKASMETSDD